MTYKYENSVINELEELEDEYKINYKNKIDEVRKVYRKAKSFDELVEYKRNIMEVKEISLTHATEEPFNSDMYSVHSLVDNLLDVINEYEGREHG